MKHIVNKNYKIYVFCEKKIIYMNNKTEFGLKKYIFYFLKGTF
jgi:hypothetical protein